MHRISHLYYKSCSKFDWHSFKVFKCKSSKRDIIHPVIKQFMLSMSNDVLVVADWRRCAIYGFRFRAKQNCTACQIYLSWIDWPEYRKRVLWRPRSISFTVFIYFILFRCNKCVLEYTYGIKVVRLSPFEFQVEDGYLCDPYEIRPASALYVPGTMSRASVCGLFADRRNAIVLGISCTRSRAEYMFVPAIDTFYNIRSL